MNPHPEDLTHSGTQTLKRRCPESNRKKIIGEKPLTCHRQNEAEASEIK